MKTIYHQLRNNLKNNFLKIYKNEHTYLHWDWITGSNRLLLS